MSMRPQPDGTRRRLPGLTLGVLCLLVVSGASRAADPLEFHPSWKQGEKRHYEIVRTTVRSSKGMPRTTSLRQLPKIEVLSAGKDGYVVAWTLGRVRIDTPGIRENPFVRSFSEMLSGHRMVIELEPDGSFRKLRNWKELRQKALKAFDSFLAEMKKAGYDSDLLAAAKKQIAALAKTEEQVTEQFAHEAQVSICLSESSSTSASRSNWRPSCPTSSAATPFPAASGSRWKGST
jgi:hypothetical protein